MKLEDIISVFAKYMRKDFFCFCFGVLVHSSSLYPHKHNSVSRNESWCPLTHSPKRIPRGQIARLDRQIDRGRVDKQTRYQTDRSPG